MVIVLTDLLPTFINFINGSKRAHDDGMKTLRWIVLVTLAFVGLAGVAVPLLNAQQRKCARYVAGQAPEGTALFAQVWDRSHAMPGR